MNSLAIRSNGTLAGWGNDWWGQVDDIPEGNDFVAISAGEFHGLALKSDGTIVMWGNNDARQLRTPTIMVFERYSYDAFGKPEIRNTNDEILTTSSFGNRYMFTGREYDTETGNYYYRARYYSPKLGRFLQTDPIGYRSGLNLYSYCKNNPIMWVDPYGLSRYWRWSWWDVLTFAPHFFFDAGVTIGDTIVGTPETLRQAERAVNAPAEIRRDRSQMMNNIMEDPLNAPLPTTAGPYGPYKEWRNDVTDTSLKVPGTSLTGPLPTDPRDIAEDVIVDTVENILEEVSDKTCPNDTKSGQ